MAEKDSLDPGAENSPDGNFYHFLVNHSAAQVEIFRQQINTLLAQQPSPLRRIRIFDEHVGDTEEVRRDFSSSVNDIINNGKAHMLDFMETLLLASAQTAPQLQNAAWRAGLYKTLYQVRETFESVVECLMIDISEDDPRYKKILRVAELFGDLPKAIRNIRLLEFQMSGKRVVWEKIREALSQMTRATQERDLLVREQVETTTAQSEPADINIIITGAAHIAMSRNFISRNRLVFSTLPEHMLEQLPPRYRKMHNTDILSSVKMEKIASGKKLEEKDIEEVFLNYILEERFIYLFARGVGNFVPPYDYLDNMNPAKLLASHVTVSLTEEERKTLVEECFTLNEHRKFHIGTESGHHFQFVIEKFLSEKFGPIPKVSNQIPAYLDHILRTTIAQQERMLADSEVKRETSPNEKIRYAVPGVTPIKRKSE